MACPIGLLSPGNGPFLGLRTPLANDVLPRSALSARYRTCPIVPCGGDVMEPNSWPLDPVFAAALVTRVIDDIDASDDEQRDALLCDLLCAASGSILAQNQ